MRGGFATAILLLTATPALPHRLDEYLQGTILSVEKDRLQIQMTLTPGVAISPHLISQIDKNADGAISETEANDYAARVLHDLSIMLDGDRLVPHLVEVKFPTISAMKDGVGEVRLDYSAELPRGGRNRKLTVENHHESKISAYQVNCLAPRDPDIRISGQERNYSQSLYRLDYVQANVPSGLTSLAIWFSGVGWLGMITLLVLKRAALGSQAQLT